MGFIYKSGFYLTLLGFVFFFSHLMLTQILFFSSSFTTSLCASPSVGFFSISYSALYFIYCIILWKENPFTLIFHKSASMYLPGDDAEPWSRHQLRIHLNFPRCLTALRSLFWKWAEKHQCRIQVRNHWKLQRFEESRECTLNCWKGSSNQRFYTWGSFLPADERWSRGGLGSSCTSVLLNPGLTQLCFICIHSILILCQDWGMFSLSQPPPAGGFPWSWGFPARLQPSKGNSVLTVMWRRWILAELCRLEMEPSQQAGCAGSVLVDLFTLLWLAKDNAPRSCLTAELKYGIAESPNEGASLTLSVDRLRGCLC